MEGCDLHQILDRGDLLWLDTGLFKLTYQLVETFAGDVHLIGKFFLFLQRGRAQHGGAHRQHPFGLARQFLRDQCHRNALLRYEV